MVGIGHLNSQKQSSFFNSNWKHQHSHGGELRKKQLGRGQRPLSTKAPIHTVFKAERFRLRHRSLRSPQNFALVHKLIKKYSEHFYVKVEQLSIQHDHIHLLIRTTRRRQFHHFFRVVAGQIAQCFEKEGLLTAKNCPSTTTMTDTPAGISKKIERLWKHRPFTRVVMGGEGLSNYKKLYSAE